MRISELSRASDVPVATIKFYLREGLLHEGARRSATQAAYDDTHVARLRMVRALVGVGGMSLARVKQVLAAIDDPPESVHDLLGVASLTGRPLDDAECGEEPDPSHLRVHRLLEEWGWDVEGTWCGTHAEIGRALEAIDAAGIALDSLDLDGYRDHMTAIADGEVTRTPLTSREDAVRYVALGVPLVEPLLLGLRRLAHQRASARLFADTTTPRSPRT